MSAREIAYLVALLSAIAAYITGVPIWASVVMGCAIYIAIVVDRTLAIDAEQKDDAKKFVEYSLKGTAVPMPKQRKRLP